MVLVKSAGFVPLLFFVCLGDIEPGVREHIMSKVDDEKTYTSPIRKLLVFFERSRDDWKEKCKNRKVLLKRAASRIAGLTKSRNQWRELARQRQRELSKLRRELDAQKATMG